MFNIKYKNLSGIYNVFSRLPINFKEIRQRDRKSLISLRGYWTKHKIYVSNPSELRTDFWVFPKTKAVILAVFWKILQLT